MSNHKDKDEYLDSLAGDLWTVETVWFTKSCRKSNGDLHISFETDSGRKGVVNILADAPPRSNMISESATRMDFCFGRFLLEYGLENPTRAAFSTKRHAAIVKLTEQGLYYALCNVVF